MSATPCHVCGHPAHSPLECTELTCLCVLSFNAEAPGLPETPAAPPTTFTLRQQVALAVLPELIRRCRYADAAVTEAYEVADFFLAAGGAK